MEYPAPRLIDGLTLEQQIQIPVLTDAELEVPAMCVACLTLKKREEGHGLVLRSLPKGLHYFYWKSAFSLFHHRFRLRIVFGVPNFA